MHNSFVSLRKQNFPAETKLAGFSMAQNISTQHRVKKKRRNWSKGDDQKLLLKALTYYKLREDEISKGTMLQLASERN